MNYLVLPGVHFRKRFRMHKSSWILLSLLFCISCQPAEKKEVPDFLAENIDTTISPASDFFLYANGSWIRKNPIPADQSRWSVGSLINLDIYNRLRSINEKAVSEKSSPGSITQKIGDFWFSGMDSAGIEKEGLNPLKPELSEIENINNLEEFLKVAAELDKLGVNTLMGGGIYQDEKKSDRMALHLLQGGLGMPDRDYYFNTDEKSANVRNAYRDYLYKSFRTLGRDSMVAMKAAGEVYQLERRMAKASRTIAALRDPNANYHKMDLSRIQKLYRNVNWKDFLTSSGLPKIDSIIIGQPEFIFALNHELKKTPLEVWKNYLAFHLLNSAAPYMYQSVFNDRFNYARTLSGVEFPKPRWKRVLDAEENAIGEALGHLFVNEYFPEKSKKRYSDLVESMRDAYKERIIHLKWMSDSTKQKALLNFL